MNVFVVGLKCSPRTEVGKEESYKTRALIAEAVEQLGSAITLCAWAWLLATSHDPQTVKETLDDDSNTYGLLMGEERVAYRLIIAEVRGAGYHILSCPIEHEEREAVSDWLNDYL